MHLVTTKIGWTLVASAENRSSKLCEPHSCLILFCCQLTRLCSTVILGIGDLPVADLHKFWHFLLGRYCHYLSFFGFECYRWINKDLKVIDEWRCQFISLVQHCHHCSLNIAMLMETEYNFCVYFYCMVMYCAKCFNDICSNAFCRLPIIRHMLLVFVTKEMGP